MAVTIKLKNASGSDPSASDLVLGELAVRTDNGKIFLKKDNGSVAEVSGGGGVSDGDKGDITVSNSGDTWTIDNNAINQAKIADDAVGTDQIATGSIVTNRLNDDAVTYAKIQNVSATDRLLGRDSSGAGVIEEISPSSVRTMLGLAASATTDTTNADNIGSGTLAAARVATLNQDTTGSAATLTTARTIAGVSFDGSANISLNNNAITNGAGYITATLTEEQVEDYVGGMVTGNTETGITVTYQDSDGTLDFAVASQTDNNFTNSDHSKLDGIESGATADQSAAEILTAIKTVDGSGSGLDADTVDGNHASAFPILSNSNSFANSYNEFGTSLGSVSNNGSWNGRVNVAGSSHARIDAICVSDSIHTTMYAHTGHGAGRVGTMSDHQLELMCNGNSRATLSTGGQLQTTIQGILWGASNDGSGSGLDADTVDGIQASSFVRSDASDTLTGASYTLNSGTNQKIILQGASNPYIQWQESTTSKAYIQWSTDGYFYFWNQEHSRGMRLGSQPHFYDGSYKTMWHSGNDGSGSGLDADVLDGQEGSYYSNYNNLSNKPTIPTNNNQLTNGAGYVTSSGAPAATGARVWVNVEGDAGTPYFRDSYGASSLTDISYAVQQVNFSSSFSNSNYCFTSGARAGSSGGGGRVVVGYDAPATSYFKYQMRNLGNNNEHVDAACLSFFGDM